MFKIFNPLWIAQNYFTFWGGGSGGGSSTTRQQIDPMLKPFVRFGLNEAQRLYQTQTPQYYPGQTFVGPSGQTTQAMGLAEERALAGSPLLRTAQQQQQDVISGAYLQNNPYFEQALKGASQGATTVYNDAIRAAQSTAASAGRYGSGASADIQNRAANTLANTLSNKYGELAYQNYAAERARQEAAAAGAPQMAQADYYDINQLFNVGQTREDYDKTALQADIDRFNFQQNLPYQQLATFLNSVYGAPQGSVSTTTQSSGKIVCTAMNYAYGFGSFRQAIWLKHSENMHPAYERGYHTIFLKFVMWAFDKKPGKFRKVCRNVAEHIARHRTADIWKQRRGKRDKLGMIYRAILEPICFVVGKIKGA